MGCCRCKFKFRLISELAAFDFSSLLWSFKCLKVNIFRPKTFVKSKYYSIQYSECFSFSWFCRWRRDFESAAVGLLASCICKVLPWLGSSQKIGWIFDIAHGIRIFLVTTQNYSIIIWKWLFFFGKSKDFLIIGFFSQTSSFSEVNETFCSFSIIFLMSAVFFLCFSVHVYLLFLL